MKRTALTSEDGPMMSSVAVGYSKNQIDRAGEALRAYQLGVRPLNANELVLRLGIVEEFRAAHASPLTCPTSPAAPPLATIARRLSAMRGLRSRSTSSCCAPPGVRCPSR